MWDSEFESLSSGRVLRHRMLRNGMQIAYADAVAAWQGDTAFRSLFIAQLAATPFPAFFWETPPVTSASLSQPFEFVLVDSPGLAGRRAERRAFATQFENAEGRDSIMAFQNLGGDAVLVVPCPIAEDSCYAHIADFSRRAPETQQHLLWQRIGETVAQRVGSRPLWVSTSGLGVIWLHVRLDSRPKYYSYEPYRRGAR